MKKSISNIFGKTSPVDSRIVLRVLFILFCISALCLSSNLFRRDRMTIRKTALAADIPEHGIAAADLAGWALRQGRLRLRAGEFVQAEDAAIQAIFLDGCTDRVNRFLEGIQAEIRKRSHEMKGLVRDASEAFDAGTELPLSQRAERLMRFEEGLWHLCSE